MNLSIDAHIQLERHVIACAKAVGLSCKIKVSKQIAEADEDEDIWAITHPASYGKEATITFGPHFFDDTADRQQDTIGHELAHVAAYNLTAYFDRTIDAICLHLRKSQAREALIASTKTEAIHHEDQLCEYLAPIFVAHFPALTKAFKPK